jgi:hypothetical protein
VHWPDWLDCTRVKITTDYLSQYKAIVRVNELDPNDNARDFYEKACQSVADVPTEWHKVRDIWPANWSPEQRATISAWLSASEQALDYVAEGTKKSYYWHEPSGPIMTLAVPELTGVRSVVFALYARSKLYAADGKLEQAFSDLVTCFQFGEHFVGRQPIISQLVGISTQAVAIKGIFRILENIEVKPAMLGHLQTRLEQSLADRTYSLDFTAERFVIYDHIQRMFTDDGKGGGYIPEIALRIPGRWKPLLHGVSEQEKRALLKLDRRSTTILADRFFDCLADATKMTAWQFQNDTSGVRKEIELIIKRNEFIAMFGSSYIKILGMYNRSKTNLEAVIATLAILRYETEKGRLPSSLEILVDEGYINALPQDSYSDGALVYKQKEDSFLLYSYGADFDDDGGTPSKWGEGKQGGDQVFWPVEKSQNYSESAM